jgi:predicted dehydrogenase
MSAITRRSLLDSTLKGAALLAVGSAGSRILGANERVNVAIVGMGGRGSDHVQYWSKSPDAHIAAVCDVNQAALERGSALVLKASGQKPKEYGDMRKLFADKNIDVVSITTPNHWHALATIWAVQAGKDVYVEKPACHNIWEGFKMVEAARKYNRMVQVGSQSRSIANKRRAMDLLHQGVIGNLYMAKGLCFKRRKSIGHTPELAAPPAGIDWNYFLGPAPMRPFTQNRYKYNWHWFWDTGNGDIGNQGVHEMDVARWGLGVELPNSVVSTGGKYLYDDDQETPNTQLATFDYGDKQIVFEVRGLITGGDVGLPPRGGNVVGNLFYGSDGWMAIDDAGFQVYKGEKSEKVMDEKNGENDTWETGGHMANLLKAVRSRNYKDLNADVEIGVVSASMCHLANISYRVGRRLAWDSANRWIVDDVRANLMTTRDYRRPYVVPDQV